MPILFSNREQRAGDASPAASARSEQSVVDGVELAMRRWAGPAVRSTSAEVVLVHGIGVSTRYFEPLASELARRGPVTAVDLPGHGRSATPRYPFSVTDNAAVLGRLLDQLGIDAAVLVGHSMGAQVVSRLAVDRPDLVQRLVLIAPTAVKGQRTLLRQARLLALDTLRESLRVNAIVFSDYLFRCGIPYYLTQLRAMLDDRIEDCLPVIEAPTLVLRGERDRIAPRSWTEDIVGSLRNGTLRELSGPHVVMFSAPREVAALIADGG